MKVKIDEPQPPAHRSIQSCPKGEWWQGCTPKDNFAYCRTDTGILFHYRPKGMWGVLKLRENEDRWVSRCLCKSLELEWD